MTYDKNCIDNDDDDDDVDNDDIDYMMIVKITMTTVITMMMKMRKKRQLADTSKIDLLPGYPLRHTASCRNNDDQKLS